jgi:hypothetical protein
VGRSINNGAGSDTCNGPLPVWLRDWQYREVRESQVHQLAVA